MGSGYRRQIVRAYSDLVGRLKSLATRTEAKTEVIGEFEAMGRKYPMFVLLLGSLSSVKPNVMVAAGIHGDEPAGVEAALRFAESAVRDEDLFLRYNFVIFPCNNPTGYELGIRENWKGIDLNRQFNVRKPEPEVSIIMNTLEGRCFDLVVEMHEDVDAKGFYLYEIVADSNIYVGDEIIASAAAAGYPINLSDCIEGMPAHGGVIRRSIDLKRFRKTRLPQAIYVYRKCGGHVITLEPPASILPLEDRVQLELMGLRIALERGISLGADIALN